MIPKRSQYSGRSYLLFTDYNDIHVFVEDAGFENLYAEVFNRAGMRIKKVFSKTGKTSVIEAARQCNDHTCVYLVDRDWDDFLETIPTLRSLVILGKHSIENYLLDYSGFRALVLAGNPREDVDTILSRADFDHILQAVSRSLRPLFECYLAMQMARDPRPNCSLRPGAFQAKNRTCAPDPQKIRSFVGDIGIPVPETVQAYFAGEVMHDRGHGKYMLHFVWSAVRQKTRIQQLTQDSLLIRLAQTVEIECFTSLCDVVVKTATENSQQDKSSVRGKQRR